MTYYKQNAIMNTKEKPDVVVVGELNVDIILNGIEQKDVTDANGNVSITPAMIILNLQ